MKKHKRTRQKLSKHKSSKRKQREAKARSSQPRPHEWVGGRFVAPFHIEDDTPTRPIIELWVEVPSGLVVHVEIHDPNKPIPAVADGLQQALRDPATGVKPRRLRFNDAEWAAEVQRRLTTLKVIVAETPELEPVLDDLISSMSAAPGHASYLEHAKFSASDMGALFKAADALYRLAPWQFTLDEQLIEVSIPELDLHGACISVIGALGESYGFLLFPSFEGYERMAAASFDIDASTEVFDVGTTTTALNYERGADLPPTMRREVEQHGWPVATATAYPVAEHRDRDGLPRTLTPSELRIITACAQALVSVFETHRTSFETEDAPAFALSFTATDGLQVDLRSPPERAMLGEYDDWPADMDVHQLDHQLIAHMLEYSGVRWGNRLMNRIDRLATDDVDWQLTAHFGVYHINLEDGKTLAECFVEDRGELLDDRQRRWIAAQRAAWLSLWEVTAVERGESLELHDLLTDEVRRVLDSAASEDIGVHATLLGRVLQFDGVDLLAGVHPRVLPPLAGADVVERVRKYLRCQTAVAPERLREANAGRYLIKRWQEKIDQLNDASLLLPDLQNSDGDRILGTVDHFVFEESHRQRVEARLSEMDGVQSEGAGYFVFLGGPQGSGHTVIGSVRVQDGALRIESNSVERADALRERVEQTCSGLLRHRGRVHEDPLTALDRAPPQAGQEIDIPEAQLDEILLVHKQQHYANWLDEPIPALGNKTPRQAVRGKSGRRRVISLINELGDLEASVPAGQRFDMAALKQELGL